FEPNRLPDPRSARVPDALRARLPILLAARQRAVSRGVPRPHYDHVVPCLEAVGYIERERDVAASVTSDLIAVDPDNRFVINRAEVEQHAPRAPGLRYLDRAAIPHDVVKRCVANSTQLALKAVGHLNRPGESVIARIPALCQPAIGIIEFEFPRSVERLPIG